MEILWAAAWLTILLPSRSMQIPRGYDICPVPMDLMWLPFWWNTWMRLLPASATKMLSSESAKRCQVFLTCPAPTTRTNLPRGSKIGRRWPIFSATTIFPFDRRPIPRGFFIRPFSDPFDPNFLINWPWELNAIFVDISHDIISLLVPFFCFLLDFQIQSLLLCFTISQLCLQLIVRCCEAQDQSLGPWLASSASPIDSSTAVRVKCSSLQASVWLLVLPWLVLPATEIWLQRLVHREFTNYESKEVKSKDGRSEGVMFLFFLFFFFFFSAMPSSSRLALGLQQLLLAIDLLWACKLLLVLFPKDSARSFEVALSRVFAPPKSLKILAGRRKREGCTPLVNFDRCWQVLAEGASLCGWCWSCGSLSSTSSSNQLHTCGSSFTSLRGKCQGKLNTALVLKRDLWITWDWFRFFLNWNRMESNNCG